MVTAARTGFAIACCATIAFCSIAFVSSGAHAGSCNFEAQGEGRVAAVIDARSFRLDDGREVRLSGIEPADKAKGAAALSAILAGGGGARGGGGRTARPSWPPARFGLFARCGSSGAGRVLGERRVG